MWVSILSGAQAGTPPPAYKTGAPPRRGPLSKREMAAGESACVPHQKWTRKLTLWFAYFVLTGCVGFLFDEPFFSHFRDVPSEVISTLSENLRLVRRDMQLSWHEVVSFIFFRSTSKPEPRNNLAFVNVGVKVMRGVFLGLRTSPQFLDDLDRQLFRDLSGHVLYAFG